MAKVTKQTEYVCINKYCFVYNVLQSCEPGTSTECHNCNMEMKKKRTKTKKD